MNKYRLLGRHMDGAKAVGYELLDTAKGEQRKFTREQVIFLVGKGEVEGVRGRFYQDTVIIEAIDGYPNINSLPVFNVNSGEFRNVPTGNRRVAVSFQSARLIGRVIEDNRFVIQTGIGLKAIDKEELGRAIVQNKIVNARLQDYEKDGKRQTIIRLSDGSKMSGLRRFSIKDIEGDR